MNPLANHSNPVTGGVFLAMEHSGANEHDSGMTLVELMIAILLSALLTSGLFYLFMNQTAAYGTQTSTLVVQQSIGATMEYLQREVRLAGYGFGGCRGGALVQWDGAAAAEESPWTGLVVHSSCNIFETDITDCPTLPINNPDASDSLTVTYTMSGLDGNLPAVRLHKEALASSSSIWVKSGSGLVAGDLMAIWEVNSTKPCTLMEVTGTPAYSGAEQAFEIPHAAGGDFNPGVNIFPSGGYAQGALLIKLSQAQTVNRHFAIDNSGSVPKLVTWTTFNENPREDLTGLETVAEGVEDFQIAWACDKSKNGINQEAAAPTDLAPADHRPNDEWQGNVAAEDAIDCGDQPISEVRLSLSVRTATANEKLKANFRPALEDRPAGTAAQDLASSGGMGTYPRRQLTATVRPYNMAGALR